MKTWEQISSLKHGHDLPKTRELIKRGYDWTKTREQMNKIWPQITESCEHIPNSRSRYPFFPACLTNEISSMTEI